MSGSRDLQGDFERLMAGAESELDLARAALLVAAGAEPDLDVDGELRTLAGWGETLRSRLTPEMNNLQKLARLRAFAFDELGFAGEQRDYYNPRNSLLHEVMRRRRGVPLTLGIVLLELGWRAGMPLEGVGFPGHFLLRLSGEAADLLLDPYSNMRSMHEEDCRRMLLEVSGGKLDYDRRLTASVGKREMIARLLRNLKAAWLRAGDDPRALGAVERLLLLRPGDPHETRDLGLLRLRLRRYGPALEALERYLAAVPAAPDGARVRGHVAELRNLLASLN